MASVEDVEEIVFRPMLDLYMPPDGWELSADRLVALKKQFIAALAPYDRRTLARAWANVVARHYGWSWPTLQEIIREANLCS